MSDLLTRLREVECAGKYRNPHGPEAADEIERLKERNELLTDHYECKMHGHERASRLEAEIDQLRARADRAEARLRAMVRLLADLTPIGDRQRSRLAMYMDAAGYEPCKRCGGTCQDDADPDIGYELVQCPVCNGLGWSLKGEDDE